MELCQNKRINLFNLSFLFFSLLAILSFVNISFTVLMILSLSVFFVVLKPEDSLVLLAFTSCFYKAFRYQSLYASVFLGFIFIITLKAIILNFEKFKNSSKIFKIIFIVSFLYLFLQPLVFAIIFRHIYYAIIKLYIFLISLILVYFLWDKINLKKFTISLCWGIIVSCILALIGYYTGLIIYERLFMYDYAGMFRFSGIFMHPNSLARFCLLGLSLLFVVWRKDFKNMVNYFLIVAIAILGALTYSKTYFLALIIILAFFFVYFFYHSAHKKQFLISTFVVLLAIACVVIVKIEFVKDVVSRFFVYFREESILDSITSGRVSIWKAFWRDQKSSIWYILFGKSYMGTIPNRIGIHSTYLAIFYEYGIVGSLVFILFLVNMLRNLINVRFRKIRLLPTILILTTGLIGDQIFTHNGYLFLLFAMTALMEGKKNDYIDENILTKKDDGDILSLTNKVK